MRYILLIGLATLFALLAFSPSQEFKVSGIVKDENGAPIPFVNVFEKQSKNGKTSSTLTAVDGTFSLIVSDRKAVLVFQATGYDPTEVGLQVNDNTVDIVLKRHFDSLSKVVVIGYGVVKRKGVTGSVSKVYDKSVPAPRSTAITSVQEYNIARSERKEMERQNGVQPGTSIHGDTSDDDSFNTEEYDVITENRFLSANQNPLSTFSIDVDAGSYSNVRRFLQQGELPPAGAVRIEELINYFHYEYPQPTGNDPFSINTEVGDCAWNPRHRLVMIGLQGKKIPYEQLPSSNLVFLIDVSGSMQSPEKLPLVQRSLKMLVDQLREQDRVSLVVYAGNAGLVMPSTSGSEKTKMKNAIDRLEAGGSTAGGAGIQLAYKIAEQNFIKGGNNRVILCTDGDFNVGASSDDYLVRLIEKERSSGVFLTVLGYGMGNYKDSKMEKLADKGNGNHAYIDNENEAKKVLVNEFGGTLFTIAKDVKLQIEFNPAKIQSYRLIGYENRLLNKEDFNNDRKDAGELGSGHTVTAIYEVIPAGERNEFSEEVDVLKYSKKIKSDQGFVGNEIMTIKFRYKKPDGIASQLMVHTVNDQRVVLSQTSQNFRFVSSVAEFGMVLRNSAFKQNATLGEAFLLAKNSMGTDQEGYRKEFLKLIQHAEKLAVQNAPMEEDELSAR